MATSAQRADPYEQSPLVRIRSLLPGLARAEQRVARIILDDATSISRRSITDVAEAAETSETTVTRFCKAIGMGGYPQLRIALAADTARITDRDRDLGSDISESDDLAQIIDKIGYTDARTIEDTTGQLDPEALRPLVDAVATARRVDVYGAGSSAFVALDLQQKLHRIGLACFSWPDTHNALTSAAILRPGDVAIGISHTGATAETVEVLREASTRGATTATVTNFERSPITEVAQHVLTTAARETTYRSGSMTSRIAQLTVIDCLFVGVAARQLETTRAALRATCETLDGHRLESRPDRRRVREGER